MSTPVVRRRGTNAAATEVAAALREEPEQSEKEFKLPPPNMKSVISTGSTLIDLAISGKVLPEGGIPGGIFVEIFGPSGAGKTSLLSEVAASTQIRGGRVKFLDPEARLDTEYSKIYGVSVEEKFEYARPDTVSELFTDHIWGWDAPGEGPINTICADSLAALSTNLEMDKDEGDKMGMRRAKEFSEGLRKTCRLIAHRNWLIVMSNQIRMGDGGKVTTPGGQAVPFYSSLRLQVRKGYPSWQITRKRKYGKQEVEKVIGIYSSLEVVKSTVDEPFREVPFSVVFGVGIDTVRDELMYYKKMTGETTYNCFSKSFQAIEDACFYIEENGLSRDLKMRTIELWHDVEAKFTSKPRQKERT